MKARILIERASLGPDDLKTAFQAFDGAWALIAAHDTSPNAIRAARMELTDIAYLKRPLEDPAATEEAQPTVRAPRRKGSGRRQVTAATSTAQYACALHPTIRSALSADGLGIRHAWRQIGLWRHRWVRNWIRGIGWYFGRPWWWHRVRITTSGRGHGHRCGLRCHSSRFYAARSFTPFTPDCLAQWAQQ